MAITHWDCVSDSQRFVVNFSITDLLSWRMGTAVIANALNGEFVTASNYQDKERIFQTIKSFMDETQEAEKVTYTMILDLVKTTINDILGSFDNIFEEEFQDSGFGETAKKIDDLINLTAILTNLKNPPYHYDIPQAPLFRERAVEIKALLQDITANKKPLSQLKNYLTDFLALIKLPEKQISEVENGTY